MKAKKVADLFKEPHIIEKKLSMKEKIAHAWDHLKKSMKDVNKDFKVMMNLRLKGRLRNLALTEYLEYRNIQKDILKFLPFSLFILIPVGEVFLPVYLYLFPNATPSQFFSEKKIGEMVAEKIKLQKRGYEILKAKLMRTLSPEFEEIQTQIKETLNLECKNQIRTDLEKLDLRMGQLLTEKWSTYQAQLSFDSLSLLEKESVLVFMFKDFVSGVNILNSMYNLPGLTYSFSKKMLCKIMKKSETSSEDKVLENTPKAARVTKDSGDKSFHGKLTLNFFPLSTIRGLILKLQIWHQFNVIKREDNFMRGTTLEELGKCSKLQIFEIAKKRGFGQMGTEKKVNLLSDYWMGRKGNPQLETGRADESFRFWMMVLRFKYQNHLL